MEFTPDALAKFFSIPSGTQDLPVAWLRKDEQNNLIDFVSPRRRLVFITDSLLLISLVHSQFNEVSNLPPLQAAVFQVDTRSSLGPPNEDKEEKLATKLTIASFSSFLSSTLQAEFNSKYLLAFMKQFSQALYPPNGNAKTWEMQFRVLSTIAI